MRYDENEKEKNKRKKQSESESEKKQRKKKKEMGDLGNQAGRWVGTKQRELIIPLA
jgi:hypothetical protein